jgi:hypothetical protein
MVPFAAAAVFALSGAIAALALLNMRPAPDGAALSSSPRPVWSAVQWPFPADPWGKGKAFRCKAADCGSEVNLYVRAKLGFCNCTTGIADDADLDRMGDLDLIGGEVSPLGAGRPITVGSMQGRSRAYALTPRDRRGKAAMSLAFNERCDMIAVMVVLEHDKPATIEPTVIDFLNSRTVLSWAEVSLGL